MKNKNNIIQEIIEIELIMLLSVPAVNKNFIQESPTTFKLIRESSYEVWSEQALNSYLKDLRKAQQEEKNLMTLRYARMDDLIPPLNKNPLIDEIIKIDAVWEGKIREKHPYLFKTVPGDRPGERTSSKYLRAELETFSDLTLSYYYYDLLQALKDERNLVEEIYTRIFQKTGYQSLGEANLFFKLGAKSEG